MIAPSILAADFTRLGEQISEAEAAGAAWIHIDVMDGHFVPNISIGPGVVEAVRSSTELPLDVHLMIDEPQLYLRVFAEAGADLLTIHVETCRHLHRTIEEAKPWIAKRA
jgi:ribulose-phosphate 3-epimerase